MPATAKKRRKQIPSLKERRAKARDEMMEAIVQVAIDVVHENGIVGLNLQQVAEGIGVRPPSLYEYFKGKRALYDALYQRAAEIFQEMIFAKLEAADSFNEHCVAVVEGLMSFADEYPELYRLLFEAPVPSFKPSEESVKRTEEGFRNGLAILKEAMIRENIKPPIPIDQAVDMVEVMAHGLVGRYIREKAKGPIDHSEYQKMIPALVAVLNG